MSCSKHGASQSALDLSKFIWSCFLGETPLHTAAIRGSSRLVKQLLQMGADPNAQDNAEWSPLHEACNRGNLGVVKVLKEFGADLNLKGFAKDSPLHDAARNGHIKVVKFLVRSGVNLQVFRDSTKINRPGYNICMY